jgi:tetratricopeptide (TPR) repeat protein
LLKIAGVLLHQGDLDEARRRQEQAIALEDQIGEKISAAGGRAMLARTLLEMGRAAEAEPLARAAAAAARSATMNAMQAGAEATLADILIAERKLDDARAAIRRANDVLQTRENRPARLAVNIAHARVLVASGNLTEAQRTLQSAIREARQLHVFVDELECRLALIQSELAAGKAAGAAHAEALERQARARGFELIARKAAVLRSVHRQR